MTRVKLQLRHEDPCLWNKIMLSRSVKGCHNSHLQRRSSSPVPFNKVWYLNQWILKCNGLPLWLPVPTGHTVRVQSFAEDNKWPFGSCTALPGKIKATKGVIWRWHLSAPLLKQPSSPQFSQVRVVEKTALEKSETWRSRLTFLLRAWQEEMLKSYNYE